MKKNQNMKKDQNGKKRKLRLNYLRQRYAALSSELKSYSEISKFTHGCNNHLFLLEASMRLAIKENIELDTLEDVIVSAEHYLVEVAQTLEEKNG